jgi:hypothetical protein
VPLRLLILLAALAGAAMPGGGAAWAQEWWSTSWEKNGVLEPCVIELGLL